jgi:long-chain acyl-CoA synthetase
MAGKAREPVMETIIQLETIFRENWDEVFIVDPAREIVLTYGEFFSVAYEYSRMIESHGIQKGDKVALVLNNSLELSVLYFSLMFSGNIVIPVDPRKGKDEIDEIIFLSHPQLIINDVPVAFPGAQISGLNFFTECSLGDVVPKKDHLETIIWGIDSNTIFLISFTSGSTGVPKGVIHSFNNLFTSASAFRNKFTIGRSNVFYHNLPMTYMAGILNLLILPFVSGSRVILGERFSIADVSKFWKIPVRYSVNTFWFIPTMISLLVTLDRGTEGRDYYEGKPPLGFVGTAPMNSTVRKQFTKKYGIPLYESYGLTETLFVTTNVAAPVDPGESVGEPLQGVELAFAPDKEILIHVPWMFLGYYNRDAENLVPGETFASGDIGELDETGHLFITGRKKDLIIRGGINISPKKIESQITEAGIFNECAVTGITDRNLGEKTVCFYTTPDNLRMKETIKELRSVLVRKLGLNYSVDEFFRVREIPKNLNGKIDKKQLVLLYEGKQE